MKKQMHLVSLYQVRSITRPRSLLSDTHAHDESRITPPCIVAKGVHRAVWPSRILVDWTSLGMYAITMSIRVEAWSPDTPFPTTDSTYLSYYYTKHQRKKHALAYFTRSHIGGDALFSGHRRRCTRASATGAAT